MRDSHFGTMDSTELETLLTDCGVAPALASQLVGDGWNTKNFQTIVSDVSEFEGVWDQLGQENLPLVQNASIRAAWKQLQEPSAAPVNPSAASSPSPLPTMEGSWSESFPPKIQASKVAQLKKQFLTDYPSEVLNAETMPSFKAFIIGISTTVQGRT